MREGYTKKAAFGLKVNFKEPAKGTAPTEAETSVACLRNRKVSVAGEWGEKGQRMVAMRSDRMAEQTWPTLSTMIRKLTSF